MEKEFGRCKLGLVIVLEVSWEEGQNERGYLKTRRMRRAGHVALMGRGEVRTGLWWGDLRERDHFEDVGVDGRILLERIFYKYGGCVNWIDLDEKRHEKRDVVCLCLHRKIYEPTEDGQELRSKHAGAIINRSKHLKQVGVKY